MNNLRKVLLIFSTLMAIGTAGLLAWANWPVHPTIRTSQLHLIAPESWNEMDARQLNEIHFNYTITYPQSIKNGQTGSCQVVLDGLPASVRAAGGVWQLHIRSELILPGFLNQQEGMLSQAVQEGSPLLFNWGVTANMETHAAGTLRLYADYLSAGNQIESQLLSVTDLDMTSSSFAGLSTREVTSLAVAILLMAGLMGGFGITRPRI